MKQLILITLINCTILTNHFGQRLKSDSISINDLIYKNGFTIDIFQILNSYIIIEYKHLFNQNFSIEPGIGLTRPTIKHIVLDGSEYGRIEVPWKTNYGYWFSYMLKYSVSSKNKNGKSYISIGNRWSKLNYFPQALLFHNENESSYISRSLHRFDYLRINSGYVFTPGHFTIDIYFGWRFGISWEKEYKYDKTQNTIYDPFISRHRIFRPSLGCKLGIVF